MNKIVAAISVLEHACDGSQVTAAAGGPDWSCKRATRQTSLTTDQGS